MAMDADEYRNVLDEFEKKHASDIDRVHDAHEAAIRAQDGVLDELVLECATEAVKPTSDGEEAGSKINNDGFRAQVACILEGFGVGEGEAKIREALGVTPAPSA